MCAFRKPKQKGDNMKAGIHKKVTRLHCEQLCELFVKVWPHGMIMEENKGAAYCKFCGEPLRTLKEMAELEVGKQKGLFKRFLFSSFANATHRESQATDAAFGKFNITAK